MKQTRVSGHKSLEERVQKWERKKTFRYLAHKQMELDSRANNDKIMSNLRIPDSYKQINTVKTVCKNLINEANRSQA